MAFLQLLYDMLTDDTLRENLSSLHHSYDIPTTIKQEIGYLLTRDGIERFLFDLDLDPSESKNITSKSNDTHLPMLLEELDQIQSENQRLRKKLDEETYTTVDADTRKQLEDLGYKM